MRDRIHHFALLAACLLPVFTLGCSQADTEAQAQKPAANPIEYIGAAGVKGNGPGQLQDPTSIATDRLGNIYVADAGSGFIHKFDSQGKPLLSFQEDPLKHPQSIAVDYGGAIYVTDPVRGSVFICFPQGDRYRELRLRKRPGKENTLGVAVGDGGLIHVLDTNAGKVLTFTPRFRQVDSRVLPGNSPGSQSQSGGIAMGPDGDIYVALGTGGRILRFSEGSHELSEISASANSSASGTTGKWSDEFAVWKNYVFVMDVNGRMLHVETTDGKPKLDLDLAPELGQAGRLAPSLAVSIRGELLVLDAPEARILRYRINF